MAPKSNAERELQYYRDRVTYLEESQRMTQDALSLAAELGTFRPFWNDSDCESALLNETLLRLRKLMRFAQVSIYLVDADMQFRQAVCEPLEDGRQVDNEFLNLVEERTVAWALQRNRSTFSRTADGRDVLLHPLLCEEKIMGLFMGVLEGSVRNVLDSSLSILAIILQNSAGALENLALRNQAETAGRELSHKVAELEREIDRRDRAESGLRNSRVFLNKTLDAVPEPVLIKDRDAHWIVVNDAMARFFNMKRSELLGKRADELFKPEDARRILDVHRRVLATRGEESVEMKLHLPGRVRYVSIKNAFTVHPETGEHVVLGVIRDLTDQKMAEERIRKERRQLFALLEGLPAFVYVQGRDGVIRYGNKAFRAIFGDGVDRKCFNVFRGPERKQRCRGCRTKQIFEDRQPVILEKEYVPGRVHMLYEQYFEHADEGPCVLVMGIDVTEERAATEALRESERRYRDIYDNIQDIYFELDYDGRVVEISPSISRFTPLERPDVIGRDSGTAFADPGQHAVIMKELREVGEVQDREVLMRSSSHDPVYFSLSAERRTGPDGKIKFVGSLHDIDSRRRAELGLKKSEAKYRELVQNAHSIIMRWTPEGHISFFNEHGQQLFGLREHEILDRHVVGTILPDADRHGTPMIVHVKSILAGIGDKSTVQTESEHVLRDGSKIWCSWTHRGILDGSGKLREVLSVGADITSRRRSELELRKAKREAEAASEAKSEFLANMSHEIRTPLNGTLGMLQLLMETSLDDEQRGYIEIALESGRSLLTVINDILDLSKIEAGRFEPEESRFDLYRLVASVAGTFEHQAQMSGVRLTAEVHEDVPAVLVGDGGRVRQILFNLVGNAMKFTHEGEVRLEISMLPKREGRDVQLLFCVRDTGIGIPEDKVNMIFDSFTQVDGSYTRKYQGSGLGLGIVRRLVHHLGGTLSIDSAREAGTDIAFRLDFTQPRNTRKTCSQENPEACDLSSAKVLVVEDNRVNRIMACRSLEKLGYETETACNGEEALEVLNEKGPFDCVLMDMQMPRMDGMEAARRIRQGDAGEESRTVPIIALTAHAMQGDREKFISGGMDAYLPKPFEMADLRRVVQRLSGKNGS